MTDGFLSRWSRRKVDARGGKPLAEPVALPAQPAVAAQHSEKNAALPQVASAQTAPETEAPALTLDDVRALTAESDFKPFAARSVAPEVRNAAMKKLFADPHFNVMDGLDIYIDDYSKPDPLPLSMLKNLASAHFMKLVEPDPADPVAAGAPGTVEQPEGSASAAQRRGECGAPDMAPSAPCTDLPSLPQSADHADTDLRLQPDHAAGAQGAGPGAA